MCEICRQTPCHPRCPNAPEPKPVEMCCLCDEGIYEGDEYLNTTDGRTWQKEDEAEAKKESGDYQEVPGMVNREMEDNRDE